MSEKKLYNFFRLSSIWLLTEEQAEKYAKDFDLRYEEVLKDDN